MVVPLRQHERRSARVHRLDDVVADAPVASVVVDQFLIERLELHSLVRVGSPARLKRRRLHEDEMFKRAGCRLRSGVARGSEPARTA